MEVHMPWKSHARWQNFQSRELGIFSTKLCPDPVPKFPKRKRNAPTGSSIWSRSRPLIPANPTRAPTAPIINPSHGWAKAQSPKERKKMASTSRWKPILSTCSVWHRNRHNDSNRLNKNSSALASKNYKASSLQFFLDWWLLKFRRTARRVTRYRGVPEMVLFLSPDNSVV